MIVKNILLFASTIIVTCSVAFAQTATSSAGSSAASLSAPDAALLIPEPKIKTGVIASSGTRVGGGSDGVVNVNTVDSTPGDDAVAITGGVSNLGEECVANLQNSNPRKSYKVRFDVIGNSQKGTQVFRKPYTGSIAPAGKLSKTFSCKSDVILSLDLKSVEPVK